MQPWKCFVSSVNAGVQIPRSCGRTALSASSPQLTASQLSLEKCSLRQLQPLTSCTDTLPFPASKAFQGNTVIHMDFSLVCRHTLKLNNPSVSRFYTNNDVQLKCDWGLWSQKKRFKENKKKRECTGNEEDSLYLNLSWAILSINICTGMLNQIRFYTTTPQIVEYIPGIYYVPKVLPAKNVLTEITFIRPQGISLGLGTSCATKFSC